MNSWRRKWYGRKEARNAVEKIDTKLKRLVRLNLGYMWLGTQWVEVVEILETVGGGLFFHVVSGNKS